MPAISIIVPVYKAETTIERCVDSLRKQTFSDIEIILVNDGSPDHSGSLCDAFAKEDPRIRVIHQKNGGVSSARNAALEVAAGKYLMFCDSDDYVAPEWCQWMYEAMQQDRVHMAVCAVASLCDGTMVHQTGVAPQRCAAPAEFIEMISCSRINELWNKIFRTDIIRNHGLRFDQKISRCEDVLFVLEYLTHIGPHKYLCYGSPVLYYYVNTTDGLSKKYVPNYLQIELEVLSRFKRVFHQFGICEADYLPWYSSHAALLLTGVIANVFLDRKHGSMHKLLQIREVVSCEDYDMAVRFNGLEQVVRGKYLQILKTKNPLLIFCYHVMSGIKNQLHHSCCASEPVL